MPWSKNFDKKVDALDRLDKAVMSSMQKGTDAGAKILASAVSAAARVDTGELRGAIKTQSYKPKSKDSKATRVFVGPFYRRFLEFGTSKMPAYPFIGPAFASSSAAVEKAVLQPINEAIEKAFK